MSFSSIFKLIVKQNMLFNKHNHYQDKDKGQGHLNNLQVLFFSQKIVLKILLLVIGITATILLSIFLATKFQRQDITIIVIFLGNQKLALQSFRSIQKNTYYPMIVGLNDQFLHLKRQIKSMRTSVFEIKRQYTIKFLQLLLSKVNTQYFFFTTTEWLYRDDYFLKYSKSLMEEFHYISQVLPRQINSRQDRKIGFTFAPGLHRLQDYGLLKKFYSKVSPDAIFTAAEQAISQFYLSQGLKATSLYRFGLRRIQKVLEQNLFEDINGYAITSAYSYPYRQTRKSLIKKQMIRQFVQQILGRIEDGPSIFQIQYVKQLKQLPFCLVVQAKDPNSKLIILESISRVTYSNKKIINLSEDLNYQERLQKIYQRCSRKSILIFVNQPLKQNALQKLNRLHQTSFAWVTYHEDPASLEICSFYLRIYQLLSKNDFQNTNLKYLRKNDRTVQALGLLQLCIQRNKQIPKSQIYKNNLKSYFSVNKDDQAIILRQTYQKLLRLSQDRQINLALFQKYYKKVPDYHRNIRQEISIFKMIKAQQRQQQIYLPQNHTIFQLQQQQYEEKYKIQLYKPAEKQMRFCLTVLSHNNIEQDRYKKAIDSIILQNYQNYHIVFIDDMSNDANMNASIKYFQQVGFPKERITFVQNLKRNFATYNIINAAFNYCDEDDIQVLLDGDDELIGKNSFQLLNSAYQQNSDLWIVYSNYKNNQYQYGRSQKYYSQQEYQQNGKRIFVSNIGPIRTWRVKLIYQIPPLYHKMSNGQWLDTVYDDAIQLALIQLATIKRVKYISEICYEYNVNYGDNDDSTKQKIMHRVYTFQYILQIPPLAPLQSLKGAIKNKEIAEQLKRDERVRYEVIYFENFTSIIDM